MPSYESPSLYIDFSRLPPPQVIEDIDYEVLLNTYRADILAKNPKLERALKLEQSGANIILQAQAYGEMITRSRVNAAARAVMLPFATGNDLETLAAFFGVRRETIPGDEDASPPIPESPETDASLRRRAQLAPEAFATAGSEGAYIYHALSADPRLRDATAVRADDKGGVRVTIMNSGANPVPTDAQVEAVFARMHHPNIKPLTDVVSVTPVQLIPVTITANLVLYPGPDQTLVMNDVQKSLQGVRDKVSLIGRDLTLAAIYSALYQEGVQSVELLQPTQNIVVSSSQAAWIETATINVLPNRTE